MWGDTEGLPKYLFRKTKGKSASRIAENAQQEGYIKAPDPAELIEALKQEQAGKPQVPTAMADKY